MDTQEIERRRKRARDLGVDRLITRIYFDLGFRNFSLMHASVVSPIFPSAKNVVERERDRLDFIIDNKPYAIRVRERSYDQPDGLEVEIYRHAEVVFGAILRRKRKRGQYQTEDISTFVEGPWLIDFKQLEREGTDYFARRKEEAASAPTPEKPRRPWYHRLLRTLGIR